MCDTLAIVRDGRVWFAKNSDRDPNEAQLLEWHPRQQHAPGARLKATWIEIPQVASTHAVLLSRPFWMWGAEMGTNELGVTIGNEAVFTREPYADVGLTGMDLLRLALERAASAAEALDVILKLIETFGQGGGCGLEKRSFTYHNSFIVADPREAYVLETAGKWSAVEKISGARSISNGLTIPGFAQKHQDRIRGSVAACQVRQARTQRGAERAESVADLMRLLRDHGTRDGAPRYRPLNGALSAPCAHAGGLLAATQTTASWVAELSPGGCRHWATATAAPCLSLFKPIDVHEPIDVLTSNSLGPEPSDTFDPRCFWWRHELLHRRVCRDYARLAPALQSRRDEIEAAWLRDRPTSQEAFAVHDQFVADELVRAGALPDDRRPLIARKYWDARDRRARIWQTKSALPHVATAAGNASIH